MKSLTSFDETMSRQNYIRRRKADTRTILLETGTRKNETKTRQIMTKSRQSETQTI